MKKACLVVLLIGAIMCPQSWAAIIADGDFSNWDFGSVGSASVTNEPSNGNPGQRLNITTVSGSQVYGLGIKNDFIINSQLEGSLFTLSLDVLSGPGATGEGQKIYLLVEQELNIYALDLDITGYPLNWDTLSFSGSLSANSFVHLSGSGATGPDFNGGIDTYFGFSGSNSNSGTLTQYYDNFSLEITPVPLPPTILLFLTGLLSLLGVKIRESTK